VADDLFLPASVCVCLISFQGGFNHIPLAVIYLTLCQQLAVLSGAVSSVYVYNFFFIHSIHKTEFQKCFFFRKAIVEGNPGCMNYLN